MIPPAYVANPLIDTVIHSASGVAQRIDVAAYSRVRGFMQGRLSRGETPGFDAALRFLQGEGQGDPVLSPDAAMGFWQTGLIVLPQECAEPFTSPNVAITRDDYVRHGVALLPELVTPEATRLLVEHYRAWVAAGMLVLGDQQANRYRAHNDPAGRVALKALRATVEQVVGNPIKSSYAYASLYCAGAELPRHRDRPQCRYTLSLQIDHQPLPPDHRSPWPVQVYLDKNAPPIEYFQMIGGAILFRGCDIPHGRPALATDQTSWVLLLHYVDADFDGSLN